MYYEVVNITQQYRDRNIEAVEAMDTIIRVMFPKGFIEDYDPYVKKLIAFMWDISEDDIINLEPERGGDTTLFKAKCMFTKLLSYKKTTSGKYITKTKIASLVGINSHASVKYRLKQHDIFYEMDTEYKYIYDIASKILL